MIEQVKLKPICPLCNKVVVDNSWMHTKYHCHNVGIYIVYYDNYTDAGGYGINILKTCIHISNNRVPNLLSLDGFIYLDEQRIERLLLLK